MKYWLTLIIFYRPFVNFYLTKIRLNKPIKYKKINGNLLFLLIRSSRCLGKQKPKES